MKKLRLKRISVGPNQYNNFCYVIISGDTTGMAGIVEKNGVKMLFSFSRVGTLALPFNAQLDERVVGDKKYFNLIDSGADAIGEVAYLASTAKRAGIGADAIDAEAARHIFAGINTQSKAQSKAVAEPQEQPAVEENATEPVAGPDVAEEVVDENAG